MLYVNRPGGRVAGAAAATWSTRSAQLNQLRADAVERSGNRHAHRPVRDGVPDADQRAGADGYLRRAAARARPVRHAGGRRHVRGELPAGPPAGRAGRAVHSALSPRLGPSRRRQGRRSPASPRKSIRPCAALITDLKNRGMLDDTLIVWGGEFGRTPMAQGNGRDHHMKGFSIWLAGGGIKGGITYGATDELGYNAVENIVDVHDLHATMLHLLGIDHERFTYRYQGRDFRLTDVKGKCCQRQFLASRTTDFQRLAEQLGQLRFAGGARRELGDAVLRQRALRRGRGCRLRCSRRRPGRWACPSSA